MCQLNFTAGSLNAGTLQISYEPTTGEIQYKSEVSSGYFQATGFGTDMTNTDMIAWFTNSTGPQQEQLYSVTTQDPSVVTPNVYTTTNITNIHSTTFQTTRPLSSPGLYTIPLDQVFPIVWAWQDTDSVKYHGNNRGSYNIYLDSTTGDCSFNGGVPPAPSSSKLSPYAIHGIIMAVAWTFVSIVQVYTGRYLKHWWRQRHLIHAVAGGISGVLTLTSFIIVMGPNALAWSFYWDHFHNVAGTISFFLCMMLVLGGVSVFVAMKSLNFDWKTR